MAVVWGDWIRTAYPLNAVVFSGKVAIHFEVGAGEEPQANVTFECGSAVWMFSVKVTQEAIPPPVHRQVWYTYDFGGEIGTVPWSDLANASMGTETDIEVAFSLTFDEQDIYLRIGEEYSRGITLQHLDELRGAEQWGNDENTTADLVVGAYSHNRAAGTVATAFADTWSGPSAELQASGLLGLGSTVAFKDLSFCGQAVPCAGITSTAATGSADDVTCTDNWLGYILRWYSPAYASLPLLKKWDEEFTDARLVDAIAILDGSAYKREDALKGWGSGRIWTFTCTPGTWVNATTTYDAFDGVIHMAIQAVSAAAGGSHPDLQDLNLGIPVIIWQVNATTRTAGPLVSAWDALTVTGPGKQEAEFAGVGATRLSDWVAEVGGGVVVTNGAALTRFQGTVGLTGYVARTLVNRYFTRIAASGTPWVEVPKLYPQDADEDHWNWTNRTFLKIAGSFTWTTAGAKTFIFDVRHTVRTAGWVTDNRSTNAATRLAGFSVVETSEWVRYYVTLTAADNGVTENHLIDLRWANARYDLPRLYCIREIRFVGLTGGDDIQFTSMELWPWQDGASDSARFQSSVPFSLALDDHFGFAALVGGAECWELTEDNVAQGGNQTGIAHCDYLQTLGSDVSDERTVSEIATLIGYQDGWGATRETDGDAALQSGALCAEHSMFLRQQAAGALGTVQASIKVAQFEMAGCLDYSFEFEGRVQGALHGLGRRADGSVVGAGCPIRVYRLDTGALVGTALTDARGHWIYEPVEEDPTYTVAVPGA